MYTQITLPHGFDFKSQTLEQAKENVWAFIRLIPERVRVLEALVQQELPAWRADLSEESLASLGEWYAHHVEERVLTKGERERLVAKLGSPWEVLVDVEKPFTEQTVSYGLDIGIYVGECIRARCPATVWKRGTNPKNTLNRPILAGFETKSELDPLDIGNDAARMISRARRYGQSSPTKAPETVLEQVSAAIAKIPPKDPKKILGERLAAWQSSAM